MDKERILEDLEGVRYKYSDEAVDVVENCINNYDDDDEISERVWEEVVQQFIYYSDAFDYLQSTNNTDFEDAIKEGFGKNVCTIASYYLEQEVYDLLRNLDVDY